jgi:hypothetical protein
MISTPSSQKRCFRWRNHTQIYAERISSQKWAEHREFIRYKQFSGFTKNEILESLKEEKGFCPSYEQLRGQMKQWNLSESKQEEACERQLLDELERSIAEDRRPSETLNTTLKLRDSTTQGVRDVVLKTETSTSATATPSAPVTWNDSTFGGSNKGSGDNFLISAAPESREVYGRTYHGNASHGQPPADVRSET